MMLLPVLPVLPASLLPAPGAPAQASTTGSLLPTSQQLPLPLPLLLCCCHPVTMPPVPAHANDPRHRGLISLQICNPGSRV